jgi:hypothetical protein
VVLEDKVGTKLERQFRAIGLGVLVVGDTDTNEVVLPRLRCFRLPASYTRFRTPARKAIQRALTKIRVEDVRSGLLSLAEVLEMELDRKVPAGQSRPLGTKITEAEKTGLLPPCLVKKAERFNGSRVLCAHRSNHADRRAKVVGPIQEVVDDCLTVLEALA